jgi:hypothetical protein
VISESIEFGFEGQIGIIERSAFLTTRRPALNGFGWQSNA